MRIPERDTAVFSTSAIDLFASALGAFILLVMLLFPYYQNAGTNEAFAQTEAIMEQRRLAAGKVEDMMSTADELQSELERLELANQGMRSSISQKRQQLSGLEKQVANIPVPVPSPEVVPDPEPVAIDYGVEFSILGLATEAHSFVILIDMSGSMINYADLMISSVKELLAPLNERNEFAIIGYQGNPEHVLWRFPASTSLLQATPENLKEARIFTENLSRRFFGSTPTYFALQAALEYPANSIILLSDGEPNSPPGFIIEKISSLNQFRQTEIHSVAIGDYTHNRSLVLFLQSLSRLNNGDFVGVSR
ncbi:MAG TPA: vWA domain-containing protein [Xanthomonadales bacterium]|nr:vWA domain-containing protein [Xanthomonadales bacterium]